MLLPLRAFKLSIIIIILIISAKKCRNNICLFEMVWIEMNNYLGQIDMHFNLYDFLINVPNSSLKKTASWSCIGEWTKNSAQKHNISYSLHNKLLSKSVFRRQMCLLRNHLFLIDIVLIWYFIHLQ